LQLQTRCTGVTTRQDRKCYSTFACRWQLQTRRTGITTLRCKGSRRVATKNLLHKANGCRLVRHMLQLLTRCTGLTITGLFAIMRRLLALQLQTRCTGMITLNSDFTAASGVKLQLQARCTGMTTSPLGDGKLLAVRFSPNISASVALPVFAIPLADEFGVPVLAAFRAWFRAHPTHEIEDRIKRQHQNEQKHLKPSHYLAPLESNICGPLSWSPKSGRNSKPRRKCSSMIFGSRVERIARSSCEGFS